MLGRIVGEWVGFVGGARTYLGGRIMRRAIGLSASALALGAASFIGCSSEDSSFSSTKKDAGVEASAGQGGTAGSGGQSGAGGQDAGAEAAAGAAGSAGMDSGPEILCSDNDNDGTTDCDGDCDDNDATAFPGNAEVCGDLVDNDCDSSVDNGCSGLGTYVSELTGKDGDPNYPGTKDKPVKSILQGIKNAQAIVAAQTTPSPIAVFVAEGKIQGESDPRRGHQSGRWLLLHGAALFLVARSQGSRLRHREHRHAGCVRGRNHHPSNTPSTDSA